MGGGERRSRRGGGDKGRSSGRGVGREGAEHAVSTTFLVSSSAETSISFFSECNESHGSLCSSTLILFAFHADSNPPTSTSLKKDGEKSKCKGRRVCFGGRICSIPCRACRFALVDLEE